MSGVATVNQAGARSVPLGRLVMAGYRLVTDGQTGDVITRRSWLAIGLALVAIWVHLGEFRHQYEGRSLDSTGGGDIGRCIWIGAIADGLVIADQLIWVGADSARCRIDDTLDECDGGNRQGNGVGVYHSAGCGDADRRRSARLAAKNWCSDFLDSLAGGFWTQFIIVMAVIFRARASSWTFIEIAVVVVPIVAPILLADPGANVTAVWLGVMIGLNIQTSFLTPPFGFALFYLRGVAPAVKTVHMYKGVIAFIVLQLLALVIVANPCLVNWLPNRVSLLSESSPPPRNPQLLLCGSICV